MTHFQETEALFIDLFNSPPAGAAAGPIFGPFDSVQVSRGCEIKMGFPNGDVHELRITNGRVFYDGQYYDEFSVFPAKPQSIMARHTSFERSKATVSDRTAPLVDENGASHTLIIHHGHSPAAEKRRKNFVALGKDAIRTNEIQIPICPAKYAVLEYFGQDVCNIADVRDHKAASGFVDSSETECTHRMLYDLDDLQKYWLPLTNVTKWFSPTESTRPVSSQKCPTCGSEDPCLRGRLPGNSLDFSRHDEWCADPWHDTSET